METAALAHEKGFYFRQPCSCGGADDKGDCSRCDALQRQCENFTAYMPTQSEVQQALRAYGIHVSSDAYPHEDKVIFMGHALFSGDNMLVAEHAKVVRATYEAGLEDALIYGLEMIDMIEDEEEFDDENEDYEDED